MKESKYLRDLTKRRFTHNGVNYSGGLMKIFSMKCEYGKSESGQDTVHIHFAYYPCRRLCSTCLEGPGFCSEIITDTVTVSEADFRANLNNKRLSMAPTQNSPQRQRRRN